MKRVSISGMIASAAAGGAGEDENEAPTSGVIRAGQIALDGGDTGIVEVGGHLDATRDGKKVTGGEVDVFGDRILVTGDAVIDASVFSDNPGMEGDTTLPGFLFQVFV